MGNPQGHRGGRRRWKWPYFSSLGSGKKPHSTYKLNVEWSQLIVLVQLFPRLNFVVQDGSADMIAQGKASLGNDVRGRVSLTEHNFFEPEPLRDAAAFIMRQCTHNWCDRDVVTMFKGIVPGLEGSKPGTPFLINDIVMPEPGTWPRHAEHGLRQIDMIMLVGFGAKQRTTAEFNALLKEADSRYEIRKVHADGPLGLIEVHLQH